jgi:prepilin signal peptidase PulO-like enzyme (type II secretory pathway)
VTAIENVVVGLYAGVLITATWTDLRARRIPNWLTVPATLLALVWAATQEYLMSALVGALFGAFVFILPMFLYGPGMAGGGDVKLAAFVGAVLGLSGAITALFLAGVVGAVVVLAGLATHRIERRQKIPFGPFIAIGGVLAVIVGQ